MKNKIKINFTNDMAFSVNSILQNIYNPTYTLGTNEKLVRSIGFELAEKFNKATDKLQKKANFFEVKKKTNITLKYFEAWALHQILIDLISLSNNDYEKLQVQKTLNILNSEI